MTRRITRKIRKSGETDQKTNSKHDTSLIMKKLNTSGQDHGIDINHLEWHQRMYSNYMNGRNHNS